MENAIQPSQNRIKIVAVAPEFILNLMKSGAESHMRVMENGLPEDVRVVDCYSDPVGRTFFIRVTSESFPQVAEGEPIPFCETAVFVDPMLEISTAVGVRP